LQLGRLSEGTRYSGAACRWSFQPQGLEELAEVLAGFMGDLSIQAVLLGSSQEFRFFDRQVALVGGQALQVQPFHTF
jgi:hypothetical protein